MIPLAGRDGQILDLLVRVVRIGKHRGTWAGADVVRVAVDNLPAAEPYRRTLRAERRRADAAEAEAKQLRAQLAQAPQKRYVRVAELSALTADIFEDHRRGKPQKMIAAERGMNASSVTAHIARAVTAIEADNALHAARLATEGVVQIRVKTRRKAAA